MQDVVGGGEVPSCVGSVGRVGDKRGIIGESPGTPAGQYACECQWYGIFVKLVELAKVSVQDGVERRRIREGQ